MRKFAFLCATALLAGCVKGTDNAESAADMNVTVRMAVPAASRAVAGGDMAGGTQTSAVKNGYLCFLNSAGTVVALYHIGTNVTSGTEIMAGDLARVEGVTLPRVPGSAVSAALFGNLGSKRSLPVLGDALTMFKQQTDLLAEELDAARVVAKGEGKLVFDSKNSKASVEIPLTTIAAYLKIKSISFAGVTATLDGIFINRHYDVMNLNQDMARLQESYNAVDYVKGGAVFPDKGEGRYYDLVGASVTANPQKVVPGENKYWGYCLFAGSDMPQIVIRLKDVKTGSITYSDDQFVTVGLKTAAGVPLTRLESGKVYTLEDDALVIKPEHLNPKPGVSSFAAAVTIKPVEWVDGPAVVPDL